MSVDAIVIGAGFAGLYAVHRCLSEGLTVLGIEAAPSVGGTWYWNRYPGARCDVESVDYSYSFDEDLQSEWTWTERFAAQPEILAYLDHVADRFDLRRHYRFGTEVVGARFDADGEWVVETSTGERHRGRFLLCATGCLSAVNRPDIPGLDDFAGEVYFTAAWPRDDPDLRGKKIGVIGTGSSGIQVAPILAEQAESLVVFQRSPNYTIPMPNHPWSDEDLRAHPDGVSGAQAALGVRGGGHTARHVSQEGARHGSRGAGRGDVAALARRRRAVQQDVPRPGSVLAANDIARQFAEDRIREIVDDPAVAEDLIPTDHPIGTKRICTDAGYYATFNRDNVRLVNLRREPIEAITADGVRTGDSDVRLRRAGVRNGFRRADGCDDADRSGRAGRASAVGDVGGRAGDVPRA